MTYDPEQQVMGWARRELGGGSGAQARAGSPTPRASATRSGSPSMRAAAIGCCAWRKCGSFGDDQLDAFFVDAGLSYDGAPATVISAGSIISKGRRSTSSPTASRIRKRSCGGAVTLDYPASKVHIGLPFPAWI
jgi:hypothetical protein